MRPISSICQPPEVFVQSSMSVTFLLVNSALLCWHGNSAISFVTAAPAESRCGIFVVLLSIRSYFQIQHIKVLITKPDSGWIMLQISHQPNTHIKEWEAEGFYQVYIMQCKANEEEIRNSFISWLRTQNHNLKTTWIFLNTENNQVTHDCYRESSVMWLNSDPKLRLCLKTVKNVLFIVQMNVHMRFKTAKIYIFSYNQWPYF